MMSLLLALCLGAEVAAGGAATVVLEGGPDGTDQAPLAPGTYTLPFSGASVAQGSYSGLRVIFKVEGTGRDHHELTLFIPSHDELSVDYSSSRGEPIAKHPDPPFVLQAEKTSGITDRFGRPRPLSVELAYWRAVAKDGWSHDAVLLTDCEIVVEAMSVENGALTFSGSLECQSNEPRCSLSGRFAVLAGAIGVSKVD